MRNNSPRLPHSIDDLKVGDLVKVRTCVGMFGQTRSVEVDHYGVYVGNSKIVHNRPGTNWMMASGGGVHLDDFTDFLKLSVDRRCWLKVTRPCAEHLSRPCDCRKEHRQHTGELTAERALQRVGEKRFHLRTNNSEHFAMECRFGVHKSNQFRDAYLKILSLGLFGLAMFECSIL